MDKMFDSSFRYGVSSFRHGVSSFPHTDTSGRLVVFGVRLGELPVRHAVSRSRLIFGHIGVFWLNLARQIRNKVAGQYMKRCSK